MYVTLLQYMGIFREPDNGYPQTFVFAQDGSARFTL
jgi:hypothetical protein